MKIHHAHSARSVPVTIGLLVFSGAFSVAMLPAASVKSQCPDAPTQIVETELDTDGEDGATVAMRDCGEFIAAWQGPLTGQVGVRYNSQVAAL